MSKRSGRALRSVRHGAPFARAVPAAVSITVALVTAVVFGMAVVSGLAGCCGGDGAGAIAGPPQAAATVGPAPSPAESPSRSPSTSTSPSASPSRSNAAPTPTPTGPCPSDNTVRSWYYVPNDDHETPGIPDGARDLLDTYGGRYVGDTGEKVVYLTFDEGYENGFTARILDELVEAGVRAVFFVTGAYVRDNLDLVRRMSAEGHVVASHTDTHPSLPSLAFDEAAFRRELAAVEKAYREATGERLTRLLRPPMGEYSARTLCLTRRVGYATVFWSFAHRDWLVDDQPSVAVTLERLLAGRHRGAIYLLHAVSRSNTEALPQFIAEMQARGYEFGALTELRE